jgi:hypothetical protein
VQAPTVRHGGSSIQQEVREHLTHGTGIGWHMFAQSIAGIHSDTACLKLQAVEVDYGVHQLLNVRIFRTFELPVAFQRGMGNLRHSSNFLGCEGQILASLLGKHSFSFKQIEKIQNRFEGIIYFVGERSCKLPALLDGRSGTSSGFTKHWPPEM